MPTQPTERPLYIAVVGASQAGAAELAAAETVGRILGAAGATVITGGRTGVMEAASRGAAGAGATTIGLLPGGDRREANPYVTVAIPTGLGELRNGLIIRAADAVVAVGGAYGTLSEVALALRARIPVVGVDTWAIEGIEQVPTAAMAAERALERARANAA